MTAAVFRRKRGAPAGERASVSGKVPRTPRPRPPMAKPERKRSRVTGIRKADAAWLGQNIYLQLITVDVVVGGARKAQ